MEVIREWLDTGNSILMLPGWRNSGPQHWQTLWEKQFPGIKRVKQQNWEEPVAADWVQALQRTVDEAPGRIIFIAHSLGCITQAHWAVVHRQSTARIAGTLLVAPADPVKEDLSGYIKGFLPLPLTPFPYSSIVVASDNDPVCDSERISYLTARWGSKLIELSGAGHINVEAGFGEWPFGLRQLRRLIRDVYACDED